jgi:hypothetical protein
MKHVKMLGLLAVAAAALMAFAGTASATTLTSPAGTAYTSTIKATSTHSSLHGSFISVTCTHSAVEGKVETHGAGVTAGGKISSLSFGGCNYAVTVKKTGSLEVHYANSGGGTGTVTSTGAEIAIHTSIGECIFTTSATDIGYLVGSTTKHATLEIGSAAIPRTGGSFFCGSSGEWTGDYTVTTPSTLYVDA